MDDECGTDSCVRKTLIESDGEDKCKCEEEEEEEYFDDVIEGDECDECNSDTAQSISDNDDCDDSKAVQDAGILPFAKFKAACLNRPLFKRKSLYSTLTDTIYFPYPAYMSLANPMEAHFEGLKHGETMKLSSGHWVSIDLNANLMYRMSSRVWEYNSVSNTLRWGGLKRAKKTSIYHLYWGRHLSSELYSTLKSFQRVNHFPGSWCIGRKDCLAQNIGRMKRLFGIKAYGFLPTSYIFPQDRAYFERMHLGRKSNAIWIAKPYSSSCGKGIRLVSQVTQLKPTTRCVLSRYIKNPLLINGFKWDLRIYVVVTSFSPLRIYMLDDGLVRFATRKYALKKTNLKLKRMHLTNYSVNKKSSSYVKNSRSDENSTGHKWSMQALWKYLESSGHDVDLLKQRIHDVIIKTMIAAEPEIYSRLCRSNAQRSSCFEIFGFDILVTSMLLPMLLEVNILPSLSSSSPLDKFIKTKLVTDTLNLVGIPINDSKRAANMRKTNLIIDRVNLLGLEPKVATQSSINRYRRQNTHEVRMGTLTSDELNMLREAEEEFHRRGHLERIYPTPTNCMRFMRYFETNRPANVLLCHWMQLPRQVQLELLEL